MPILPRRLPEPGRIFSISSSDVTREQLIDMLQNNQLATISLATD